MFDPRKTREMLRKHILEVTFKKKNGDERVMTCTLHPDFLPAPEVFDKGDFGEPDQDRDNIAVWDLEVGGWRSFNASSITKVEYEPL